MGDFPPLLLGCLALGLAGWWWLLRAEHGRVPSVEWRAGDLAFAAVLGGYFLLNILAAGSAERRPLTMEMLWSGISIYTLMLITLVTFLIVRGVSPVRAFGLQPPVPAAVVGLALAAFAATYPAVLVSQQLVEVFGVSVSDGDEVVQFLRGRLSASDWATVALLALVVAPVTEEVIFRGFLYGVLRRPFGAMAAMGATALLFAAVHGNLPAVPAYFLLAVGLTLAYERTGSLWTPILMHVIFNGISLAVIAFFPEWIPNS